MKEETQENPSEKRDKPKQGMPKPFGKLFERRGYEKRKGGVK